jgi:hypothetical protein
MAQEQDLAARLELAERSLVAHDFLLRALLTHLAVASPQSFEGIINGFANSRLYGSHGEAGELTREVTEQLVGMLEDIMSSMRR